jgi:hypothetical protein
VLIGVCVREQQRRVLDVDNKEGQERPGRIGEMQRAHAAEQLTVSGK